MSKAALALTRKERSGYSPHQNQGQGRDADRFIAAWKIDCSLFGSPVADRVWGKQGYGVWLFCLINPLTPVGLTLIWPLVAFYQRNFIRRSGV